MDQEEREELERSAKRLQRQFDDLCETYNFSAEERQALKDKLDMDLLIVEQHAREIAEMLESNPQTAALKIIDLIRGETLSILEPFVESFHHRLTRLEEAVLTAERR